MRKHERRPTTGALQATDSETIHRLKYITTDADGQAAQVLALVLAGRELAPQQYTALAPAWRTVVAVVATAPDCSRLAVLDRELARRPTMREAIGPHLSGLVMLAQIGGAV